MLGGGDARVRSEATRVSEARRRWWGGTGGTGAIAAAARVAGPATYYKIWPRGRDGDWGRGRGIREDEA